MAGRAKESLLGGTLQDPFIYLNNRIFKYSYRILHIKYVTWYIYIYTYIAHNMHIICIIYDIYIFIIDWKLYVRIYIYSRRTLYVCCLLGPPAIQINYSPPLFLAQVLTGDSPDFGWTVKTQRAEGRRKGLTGKQLPGCRAIGETTRPAMTIG